MNETSTQNFLALKKRTYQINFDLQNSNYESLENIGSGAYGVVCSAVNTETNEKVAIKKIPRIFDQSTTIAKRTYREIKILKHFKHDNIISIREMLMPNEGLSNYNDVYIVLDLMESDLHRIIHSQQELTDEHICYFLYQILRGLKYIHSANVIHRDLKPSNLLVNENCELKIGDFGMARGIASSVEEGNHYFMTQYVATRWYRAPELMMSVIEYTTAVDIWSVGCIFAEMLGKKQLFPGRDYIGQIKLIVNILGTPPKEFLKMCTSDIVRKFLRGLGHKEPQKWNELFPKANKKALDLVSKMLLFNPKERISVDKALKHLYLNKYHDPDDEPICIPVFDFDFEKQSMTPKMLREVINEEIMDYHKEKPTLNVANFDLRPVPKSALTRTLSGGSQEQSSLPSEGGLNAFLQQQQQSASVTHPLHAVLGQEQRTGFQSGLESKPNLVPMSTSSLKECQPVPASICGNDLFRKPMGIPTVKSQTPQTINIDAPKSSSDVEMLSAKSIDQSTGGRISEEKCSVNLTPGTKTGRSVDHNFQSDVEMLSAKVQENVRLEKSIKEAIKEANHPNDASQAVHEETVGAVAQEGKPLDTKALIKAAILNANRRRQENAESGGGDGGRSRPVTALQRQREREEKRRKKMEKAKERKKKEKKPSTSTYELSDQDKNLLARWNTMQGQAKPFVHPIRKVIQEKSGTVYQSQNYNEAPCIPEPGKEGPNLTHQSEQTLQSDKPHRDLQTTMHATHGPHPDVLGQGHGGLAAHTVSVPLDQKSNVHGSEGPAPGRLDHSCDMHSANGASGPQSHSVEFQGQGQTVHTPHASVVLSQQRQTNVPSIQNHGIYTFPGQSPGNSEPFSALHLHHTQHMPVVTLSPTDLTGQNSGSAENVQTHSLLPGRQDVDGLPFSSYLPQSLSTAPLVLPTSSPLAPIPLSDHVLSHNIGHQPNVQVSTTYNLQPDASSQSSSQSQPIPWTKSLPPAQNIAQSNLGSLPSYTEAMQTKVQAAFHGQLTSTSTDTHMVHAVSNPPTTNDLSACSGYMIQSLQKPVCTSVEESAISQQTPTPPRTAMGPLIPQNSSVMDSARFSQQRSPSPSYNPASPESQGEGSDSNQSPVLLNPGGAGLHIQTQEDKEHRIPANPNSALPELASNWLDHLSKQIMKSHVEDLTLAQTPKGTGAGYGVGLDLDTLLSEAMAEGDSSNLSKPDSAPLSASLMADWLDVSGMEPRDLEALQRELGDMGSPLVF